MGQLFAPIKYEKRHELTGSVFRKDTYVAQEGYDGLLSQTKIYFVKDIFNKASIWRSEYIRRDQDVIRAQEMTFLA